METEAGLHSKSVRHGFREFLVKDGFFYLNGRRIFLKSAHTGNAFPVGQMIPTFVKQTREDFVFAKAYGFKCIRNIAGMLRPEQLDLCDEIGLLIYSECFAAWQLGVGNCPIGDEEAMLQRFDNSTSYMIKRDRNHPCVVMWGPAQRDAGDKRFLARRALPAHRPPARPVPPVPAQQRPV